MIADHSPLDLARVRFYIEAARRRPRRQFTDAELLTIGDRARANTPPHIELEHVAAVKAILDEPRRPPRRRFATASRGREMIRHTRSIASAAT